MNERLTAIENRLYVLEHDLSVAFAIISRISAALDGNYEEFYDEATYRGLVDVHLPPYPDPGIAPARKELADEHAEDAARGPGEGELDEGQVRSCRTTP